MSPRKWTLPDPMLLVVMLLSLAVICAVLAIAAAGGAVLAAMKRGSIDLPDVLLILSWLVAGGGLAGILWALSWLCRRQYFQALQERNTMDRLTALIAERPPAGAPAGDVTTAQPASPTAPVTHTAEAILQQLRELNVNVLLNDSQRQLKRQFLLETQVRQLLPRLEAAVAAGQLEQSNEALEQLVRLAPEHPQLPALRQKVEDAAKQAEERDVAEARRHVQEVMSVGDFAQAETFAQRLLAKHPASAQSAELLAFVQRERELYYNEQRARMFRLVDREAAARHWRNALQAARDLIGAFPNSPEAQTVRARLETIAENANLEEVREMRDSIRDLFERKQYPSALQMARDLITRFPQTAAADDLRKQLPRLEELAAASAPANPESPAK